MYYASIDTGISVREIFNSIKNYEFEIYSKYYIICEKKNRDKIVEILNGLLIMKRLEKSNGN